MSGAADSSVSQALVTSLGVNEGAPIVLTVQNFCWSSPEFRKHVEVHVRVPTYNYSVDKCFCTSATLIFDAERAIKNAISIKSDDTFPLIRDAISGGWAALTEIREKVKLDSVTYPPLTAVSSCLSKEEASTFEVSGRGAAELTDMLLKRGYFDQEFQVAYTNTDTRETLHIRAKHFKRQDLDAYYDLLRKE